MPTLATITHQQPSTPTLVDNTANRDKTNINVNADNEQMTRDATADAGDEQTRDAATNAGR
jgi:hypothetical protein